MVIRDELERLCARFPACNVVAFTDLTTGMVLCYNAGSKLPQEQLDDLCQTAAALLDGQMAATFGAQLAGPAGPAVQTVLLVDGKNVELFLRAGAQPAEALCCNCTTQIELSAFVRAAGDVLAAIAGAP